MAYLKVFIHYYLQDGFIRTSAMYTFICTLMLENHHNHLLNSIIHVLAYLHILPILIFIYKNVCSSDIKRLKNYWTYLRAFFFRNMVLRKIKLIEILDLTS